MRSTPRAGSADRRGAALLAAAIAGLGLGTSGCLTDIGPTICDRSAEGNPAMRYTQGTVQNGVYMTSPWTGPLLYWPGGMRYRLEHGLGEVPRWWQAYLAFDEHGTTSATLAPAAGDQVQFVSEDEKTLVFVNGTCDEFWLLVTAGGGGTSPPAVGLEPADAGAD
jgi:hypothetical protein